VLTSPFLTDIDPQVAVKGSRDPLGVQTVWARLGRHVVGNLTTVSTSVRDFTTLILGYYFAERVANESPSDGDLAVFLRWEQLAAYARGGANGDWDFRGVERAKKNWNAQGRLRLGADSASQILSNQKTYGLWGLYTVPARSSGLVEGEPSRLTMAARNLVEDVYLPLWAKEGYKNADAVMRGWLGPERTSTFERAILLSLKRQERSYRSASARPNGNSTTRICCSVDRRTERPVGKPCSLAPWNRPLATTLGCSRRRESDTWRSGAELLRTSVTLWLIG
jgi:hypothetical protein